jgi:hypothetical protein
MYKPAYGGFLDIPHFVREKKLSLRTLVIRQIYFYIPHLVVSLLCNCMQLPINIDHFAIYSVLIIGSEFAVIIVMTGSYPETITTAQWNLYGLDLTNGDAFYFLFQ